MPTMPCPQCGSILRYSIDAVGSGGRCPKCKAVFTFPEPKAVEYGPDKPPPMLQLPIAKKASSNSKPPPPPKPPVAPVYVEMPEDDDDGDAPEPMGEVEPPRILIAEFNAVRLRFPKLCCCCGQRSPGAWFQASHTRTRGIRVIRMDTRTTDFPICRKCSDWLEDIDAVINQQVVAKDDSAEISRAISNAWMFIIIGIIFAAAIFGIVFIVLGIMQLNEAEGKKRLVVYCS